MRKEILTTAIKEMPQEFNLDELFERLVFIEEIEEARNEIKAGNKIPLEEVEKIVREWRK